MIVTTLKSVIGTDRDVDTEKWNSRRLLLRSDGMGFSLHDTIIRKGASLEMCYRNHLEAVYCIEGEGKIRDIKNNVEHEIRPGTMYALNEHDEHVLMADSQMRMVCVFNPPVTGTEVHGPDGAYPASDD